MVSASEERPKPADRPKWAQSSRLAAALNACFGACLDRLLTT